MGDLALGASAVRADCLREKGDDLGDWRAAISASESILFNELRRMGLIPAAEVSALRRRWAIWGAAAPTNFGSASLEAPTTVFIT
jgi:hypothetical protein